MAKITRDYDTDILQIFPDSYVRPEHRVIPRNVLDAQEDYLPLRSFNRHHEILRDDENLTFEHSTYATKFGKLDFDRFIKLVTPTIFFEGSLNYHDEPVKELPLVFRGPGRTLAMPSYSLWCRSADDFVMRKSVSGAATPMMMCVFIWGFSPLIY
jgi:hypothetical protein